MASSPLTILHRLLPLTQFKGRLVLLAQQDHPVRRAVPLAPLVIAAQQELLELPELLVQQGWARQARRALRVPPAPQVQHQVWLVLQARLALLVLQAPPALLDQHLQCPAPLARPVQLALLVPLLQLLVPPAPLATQG